MDGSSLLLSLTTQVSLQSRFSQLATSERDGARLQKVALALAGSFYPLHDGHMNLLLAARRRILQESKPNPAMGCEVVSCHLIPSHCSSLNKKFPGLDVQPGSADPRSALAQPVLDRYNKSFQRCDDHRDSTSADGSPPVFVWERTLIDSPKNLGVSAAMSQLSDSLASRHVKLVQVTGTDSKIQAALRNRKWGDVVIVIDARGVPQENAELVAQHMTATVPSDLPPNSSTMLRWLYQARYPPAAVPPFSLGWLTDTGYTLGAGRQGIVRLMRLGARDFLALKVRKFSRQVDLLQFKKECQVWEHLERVGSDAAPKLYTCGTLENDTFGYILSEIGTPITTICPVEYFQKFSKCKFSNFAPVFDRFHLYPVEESQLPDLVRCYLVPLQAQNLSSSATNSAAEEADNGDQQDVAPASVPPSPPSLLIKARLIASVWNVFTSLRNAHVVHRDPKAENFLQMSDGSLRICDFGVAKLAEDKTIVARGSCRHYPAIALNSNHYDYGTEGYFIACTVFELMNQRVVYGEETAFSVGDAVELRKSGAPPKGWRWQELHREELTMNPKASPVQREALAFLQRQQELVLEIFAMYDGAASNQSSSGVAPALIFDGQALPLPMVKACVDAQQFLSTISAPEFELPSANNQGEVGHTTKGMQGNTATLQSSSVTKNAQEAGKGKPQGQSKTQVHRGSIQRKGRPDLLGEYMASLHDDDEELWEAGEDEEEEDN